MKTCGKALIEVLLESTSMKVKKYHTVLATTSAHFVDGSRAEMAVRIAPYCDGVFFILQPYAVFG